MTTRISAQQGEATKMNDSTPKARRGFAAMDPAKQQAIARIGGINAHAKGTAHEFTAEEAKAAGAKGGEIIAKDREHMAKIGRKGGMATSKDADHMRAIGSKGGRAVAANREHMSDIGKVGGASRARQRRSPG